MPLYFWSAFIYVRLCTHAVVYMCGLPLCPQLWAFSRPLFLHLAGKPNKTNAAKSGLFLHLIAHQTGWELNYHTNRAKHFMIPHEWLLYALPMQVCDGIQKSRRGGTFWVECNNTTEFSLFWARQKIMQSICQHKCTEEFSKRTWRVNAKSSELCYESKRKTYLLYSQIKVTKCHPLNRKYRHWHVQ